jgi:DNA-binding NarL/FixJ family response regulator
MRLGLETEIDVVGEAADGEAAVQMCRTLEPDVVLMDVEMPGLDGITATRAICSTMPATRVVVLTLYDDPSTRARAETAGACAFVAKHQIEAKLLDAIRSAAGGAALDPQPTK